MITVLIDTTNNQQVIVSLDIDGAIDTLKETMDRKKTQPVLWMVDTLLRKHKRGLKDITKIEVNPGPGSFTGIRVGISIANALGFLLSIPVNGLPVGKTVIPVYS